MKKLYIKDTLIIILKKEEFFSLNNISIKKNVLMIQIENKIKKIEINTKKIKFIRIINEEHLNNLKENNLQIYIKLDNKDNMSKKV